MKRLKSILLTSFILIIIAGVFSCRKSEIIIEDEIRVTDDSMTRDTIKWIKENTYLLDGFIFINPGQVLKIEAGTVIKAKTGQGENSSALIISRGAKILAEGTMEEPIIFTVEGDDLEGSVPYTSRGLWGGLIILGDAPINTADGEAKIEGIPVSEPRGIYGGFDENDNSGIVKYVSIRHGGTNIGEGNEINGLTLGGVGNQTIIEHVEVISNLDDGFEFFGGTADCKYLVASFCGDDAFDFDYGYQGRLQHILALQRISIGDHCAEHDGGEGPTFYEPYTVPQIANATFIGNSSDTSQYLISFGHNGGGKYHNSIFYNQRKGVSIEYNTSFFSSYYQLREGNIAFKYNIFYEVANNQINSVAEYAFDDKEPDSQALSDLLMAITNHNNTITEVELDITDELFVINPGMNAYENLHSHSDPWFDDVDYKGAIDPGNNADWLTGWTLLYQSGLVSD